MLNLNSGIICDILWRAREFQAKEGVSFPEITDDMDANYVLADHAEDLSYQEVANAIDNLRPDQQSTLVALMYIGRGDYSKDEWEEAYRVAREEWTNKTGQYLLSRPSVADDIERGLNQLGISCND
ncbi:DUF3775 domain-containing protein [Legionella jordanis]|uniref:DUF3775 domain-containing protein n=1 Tax=Legionella jordanis TaxID=456 RepID=A0A0W0VAE0_9GAMM|nr:DUF3775 domain-containing protein [Legionella jordanis]KTD17066.1 hypothetical protein Ljor_1372 [Legionella jordanis]RMX03199.1 DUF3775 domain-containing protein [Legionella jordanis]RMX18661.1 DUF3775 domain-containing protein [Legionella jordanis]VEH12737.1 Protein of uncharacterised function (DUF3775) [Legionella jordanis]